MATAKRAKPSTKRFALQHVLLCEEVRPELGGKMTLIGYYPGDTIIVGADPALLRLAFVFGFAHLKGKMPNAATFRLERADGELVGGEITIPLQASASPGRKNIVVQTNGLELGPGSYNASIELAGEKVATKFAIRTDLDFISRLNEAQNIVPSV
jgi:hypothetical protein